MRLDGIFVFSRQSIGSGKQSEAYCTPLDTAHLWYYYSKAMMKNLQEAFQDTLRIFLRLTRLTRLFVILLFYNMN